MIFSFEPDVMMFVQRLLEPLSGFFKLITHLGSETVCIVLMAAVYWCINKQAGERIGFITLFTTCTNGALKDIFRIERPIGYPGIHTDSKLAAELETASSPTGYRYSYSFPSGHSQTAGAMYTSAAVTYRKKWGYFAAAFIILAVGLSRMVVGVHWPTDVVAGWIEGIGFSLLLCRLLDRFSGKARFRVYLLFGGAVALFTLAFAGCDDTMKSLGSLIGFIAAVAFEDRYVQFETKGVPVWKRCLRLALGLALLFGVSLGLKALFPATLLFNFLRYFLLLVIGMGIYPFLFKKLNF